MRCGYKNIERLGDRLKWIWENLPHDPDCRRLPRRRIEKRPTSIDSMRLIVREILYPNLDSNSGPLTAGIWSKYVNDSVATPDDIVKTICRVFPSMPVDLLSCESYDDFCLRVDAMTNNKVRWKNAVLNISNNRGDLAKYGKLYHAYIDESGVDFPLISKKDWILRSPQELYEEDNIVSYWPRLGMPDPVRLDGWPSDYMSFTMNNMSPSAAGKLFNGDTYRLASVERQGNKIYFTVGPGKYYDFVNTCEALSAELSDYILRFPGKTPDFLSNRGNPLFAMDFLSRSAAIGINCLTLLMNYRSPSDGVVRDVFLMHSRDTRTLEAQNVWHVVPAGGHAPASETCDNDYESHIWLTVAREFVEECFSREEAKYIRTHSTVGFLGDNTSQRILNATLRNRMVGRVFLMGLGVDPLNLKPELLITIVVDWSAALREFGAELRIVANDEGEIVDRQLDGPGSLRVAALPDPDGKTVLPAGAACLMLAADMYEQLTGWIG